jgi:hypothetical protein
VFSIRPSKALATGRFYFGFSNMYTKGIRAMREKTKV